MIKPIWLAWVLAQWLLAASAMAGSTFYKCNVDGSVQYQQVPCPSNEARKPPTVEELNAQRQKQLPQNKEKPNSPPLQVRPPASPETFKSEREPAPIVPRGSFKCDGRKYCSQMTSCAEAHYFLSNCPGVKMDGNKDGIPCEQQWCSP